MSLFVLVQPEDGVSARVTEHSTGHPALVIGVASMQLTVHASGEPDGITHAAKFGHDLAQAAAEFARRLDEVARTASADGGCRE